MTLAEIAFVVPSVESALAVAEADAIIILNN